MMQQPVSATFPRLGAALIAPLLALVLGGCGLTVTNERPTYEQLTTEEQDAVRIVLQELTALNGQIEQRTRYSIRNILDRDRINVSFREMIFTYNLGDGVVHVPTWENLTDAQRDLVQGWWKLKSKAETRASYIKFFYRFMGVSQGVKQYMFNVLTPGWVFAHRTLFNIERDAIRNALSHYVAERRQTEMWGFTSRLCTPMRQQYDSRWGFVFDKNDLKFAKKYLRDNFTELADPADPTGYMYFICRWVEMGQRDATSLTDELKWLEDLPK